MSKRVTTRWYIGAWVVWLLGVIALFVESRLGRPGAAPPPGAFATYVVMFVAAFVMFAMWVAALLRLAVQRSWAWFVPVLVFQLIGLGIIGMTAYALAGPNSPSRSEVVYRPRAT